jgi:hypothetical protein
LPGLSATCGDRRVRMILDIVHIWAQYKTQREATDSALGRT